MRMNVAPIFALMESFFNRVCIIVVSSVGVDHGPTFMSSQIMCEDQHGVAFVGWTHMLRSR